jgi:hypothetical protein
MLTYAAIFCMSSLESGSSVTTTAAWFPVNSPVANASTRVYEISVGDMMVVVSQDSRQALRLATIA